MDYYVMLQSHIKEACNAGLLGLLLIPANTEMMVQPLPTWEKRVWRETQGRLLAVDRAWALAEFVEERLEYTINMVATSELQVLSKSIPLHRLQRLPSSNGQGGRYSRGSSVGSNVRVMATTESCREDWKKVHFPPPKAWDHKAKWTQECVMFRDAARNICW
jgi:hypothetical protein